MDEATKQEHQAKLTQAKQALIEVVQTVPMGQDQQETLISATDTLIYIGQNL